MNAEKVKTKQPAEAQRSRLSLFETIVINAMICYGREPAEQPSGTLYPLIRVAPAAGGGETSKYDEDYVKQPLIDDLLHVLSHDPHRVNAMIALCEIALFDRSTFRSLEVTRGVSEGVLIFCFKFAVKKEPIEEQVKQIELTFVDDKINVIGGAPEFARNPLGTVLLGAIDVILSVPFFFRKMWRECHVAYREERLYVYNIRRGQPDHRDHHAHIDRALKVLEAYAMYCASQMYSNECRFNGSYFQNQPQSDQSDIFNEFEDVIKIAEEKIKERAIIIYYMVTTIPPSPETLDKYDTEISKSILNIIKKLKNYEGKKFQYYDQMIEKLNNLCEMKFFTNMHLEQTRENDQIRKDRENKQKTIAQTTKTLIDNNDNINAYSFEKIKDEFKNAYDGIVETPVWHAVCKLMNHHQAYLMFSKDIISVYDLNSVNNGCGIEGVCDVMDTHMNMLWLICDSKSFYCIPDCYSWFDIPSIAPPQDRSVLYTAADIEKFKILYNKVHGAPYDGDVPDFTKLVWNNLPGSVGAVSGGSGSGPVFRVGVAVACILSILGASIFA